MFKYLFLALVLAACSGSPDRHKKEAAEKSADSGINKEPVKQKMPEIIINDTLNAMAGFIAGSLTQSPIFKTLITDEFYVDFSESFSKRWKLFDSTRVKKLTAFRMRELDQYVKPDTTTLFYPFSGPDILHAVLFFPNAKRYVLVGLEPVGSLPKFAEISVDSLDDYYGVLEEYYSTLNKSLDAILNFSFFRTESMNYDLRNMEVDGTIHLLFLFLNRTGNAIVSARPVTVDSTGAMTYFQSFETLKATKLKTKGVKIEFKTPDNQLKELLYFSVNASDYTLQFNPGFISYLSRMNRFNVYLKGASYLLHKSTFSRMRGLILNEAGTVVQDDSGIAAHYFNESGHAWDFHLYGQYSKPIKMFAKQYQPLLDSMYRQPGKARPLDFGLGYNYRDKNSNFMIVSKIN